MTTACFTVITDDNGQLSRGINFAPMRPATDDGTKSADSTSLGHDSDNTYELELIAEPEDSAEFVVNPTPASGGVYLAGTTVTIDVLPETGWEIKQWIGPVYDISGDVARVHIEEDLAVLVRMVRADPTAVPAATPRPASNSTP